MSTLKLENDEGICQRGLALYEVVRRCSIEELQHLLPGISTMRATYYKLLADQTVEGYDELQAALVRPKIIGGPFVSEFDA
jgi:hypothetical protein